MKPILPGLAFCAAVAATPASAQSCSAPIEIVGQLSWQGDTCNGTTALPYLANGAIVNAGGKADVYHVGAVSNPYAGQVTLTSAADVDLSLFVCRGPCGTYSTCFAAVDNGTAAVNTADIPAGTQDYYIVVAHADASSPGCGGYHLDIVYPLND